MATVNFTSRNFKVGDVVEAGFGESIHDEDGYSRYFVIDVEGYNGYRIAHLFDELGNDDNILYVKRHSDPEAAKWCEGMTLSHYLNQMIQKK